MIRSLLALCLVGGLSLQAAEVIETSVSLQLTIHVQEPERDAGAQVLQRAALYSFKTADLIQYLSRGKGFPFTAKARLVQRLSLDSTKFFIIEKNVGELEVTQGIHFDYVPQMADQSLPFTINKKVVKKTKIGHYQYLSLGQFRVTGPADGTELLIQGPLRQMVKQVVSRDLIDGNINLVSQSVIGIGCVDFSSMEERVSGIAEGSVKINGHKIIRTPLDFKGSDTSPKTANPYPPFYGFPPVKPVRDSVMFDFGFYLNVSVDISSSSGFYTTQP